MVAKLCEVSFTPSEFVSAATSLTGLFIFSEELFCSAADVK